jgi:hypothetical protein
MKKVIFLTFALVMTCFQIGRSEEDYNPHYFPGTTARAPGWVLGEPVRDWEVSAVGSAEKSAGGLDFQRQKAMSSARVELVHQMKTYLANMIEQYVGVAGTASTTESVDAFSRSVTSNITEGTLVGSKMVKSVYGPDGTLWVLVAVDRSTVERIAKQAMQTSLNNGVAIHQENKAKLAQADLIDAIAKQRVSSAPPVASPAPNPVPEAAPNPDAAPVANPEAAPEK